MGKIDDQASAIAAIIEDVPGVGVVFDNQPIPDPDFTAYLDAFTTTLGGTVPAHVRAWTIAYVGEQRVDRARGSGVSKVTRRPTFLLRAHLGVTFDGSDRGFRDMLERVADALDADRSLDGTALDHEPVQIDLPNDAGLAVMGDVVCHYAELRLVTLTEATYP